MYPASRPGAFFHHFLFAPWRSPPSVRSLSLPLCVYLSLFLSLLILFPSLSLNTRARVSGRPLGRSRDSCFKRHSLPRCHTPADALRFSRKTPSEIYARVQPCPSPWRATFSNRYRRHKRRGGSRLSPVPAVTGRYYTTPYVRWQLPWCQGQMRKYSAVTGD